MAFLFREPRETDIDTLYELSKTGYYINLPKDREAIERKIEQSQDCFDAVRESPECPDEAFADRDRHVYLFVLEDTSSGKVVGTSQVRGGMGNPEHPNLSFQLLRVHKRSEILRRVGREFHAIIAEQWRYEIKHLYAVLFADSLSPTELGGMVMHPDARGAGLGKLLSYARLHFMRGRSRWFTDRILAEMQADIDAFNDGNAFWREVARPYMSLPYDQADLLSVYDEVRVFMYELLPRFLNLSMMSDAVLGCISGVGPYTKGAEKMLRDIGFVDVHRIDPFDGGAHLETRLSEITAIPGTPAPASVGDGAKTESLVSFHGEGGFRCLKTMADITPDGLALVDSETLDLIGAGPGDHVRVSPLRFRPAPPQKRGEGVPEIDLHEYYRRVAADETGATEGGRWLRAMRPISLATGVQELLDGIVEQLAEHEDRMRNPATGD